MKKLFERVSSYWVRYDKYVIQTDAKGVKYITAAPDARPQIIDPLEDAQTMVLDALNVEKGWIAFIYAIPADGVVRLSLRSAWRDFRRNQYF